MQFYNWKKNRLNNLPNITLIEFSQKTQIFNAIWEISYLPKKGGGGGGKWGQHENRKT